MTDDSAESSVNVDMIVQNVSEDGKTTDLTFTVGQSELERAVTVLREKQSDIGFSEIVADANLVKVSVVGVATPTTDTFTRLASATISLKPMSDCFSRRTVTALSNSDCPTVKVKSVVLPSSETF